jgi:hypothetical protein
MHSKNELNHSRRLKSLIIDTIDIINSDTIELTREIIINFFSIS